MDRLLPRSTSLAFVEDTHAKLLAAYILVDHPVPVYVFPFSSRLVASIPSIASRTRTLLVIDSPPRLPPLRNVYYLHHHGYRGRDDEIAVDSVVETFETVRRPRNEAEELAIRIAVAADRDFSSLRFYHPEDLKDVLWLELPKGTDLQALTNALRSGDAYELLSFFRSSMERAEREVRRLRWEAVGDVVVAVGSRVPTYRALELLALSTGTQLAVGYGLAPLNSTNSVYGDRAIRAVSLFPYAEPIAGTILGRAAERLGIAAELSHPGAGTVFVRSASEARKLLDVLGEMLAEHGLWVGKGLGEAIAALATYTYGAKIRAAQRW